MGGRGSALTTRKSEHYSDFMRGSKSSQENEEQIDKINDFFGAGNGGETDRWLNSLTDLEKHRITEYTGSDFENINEALRDEKTYSTAYKRGMEIQKSLENFDLKRNILVRRGDVGGLIPDTYGMTIDNMASMVKAMKGQTFHTRSLVSTSPNKHFATKPFIYHIKVPKGKGRGAYVNPISYFKNSENEFLLKYRTKMRVDGCKKVGDQLVINLSVVD